MCVTSRLRAAAPILAGSIFASSVLAAGCGSAPAPEPPVNSQVLRGVAAAQLPANPRPYGAADTAFGLNLLGAWCSQDPDANIVLSPESLASGLGMAYLGAQGTTAQAMASVLHLPAGGPLVAGLHARSAALRSLSRPGVTVASSDQLWADPTLTKSTRPSYLNALASGYGAGMRPVPLVSDPASAAQQIDAAVAAATRGHIPQLVTANGIRGAGWVLTDALYLDADWAAPFQASQTQPQTFTTAAGQQVTAKFLNGGSFPVTSTGGWTAVSLPYRGGKLAMVALLPDSGSGGCPALPAGTLGTITATLVRGAVGRWAGVAMPKVSLKSSADLADLLKALGMGVAFTSNADFRGLSPAACCISTVIHAATLDVGEKGTVGSAATAVGIEPGLARVAPSPVITFDRPYLLLVTDISTGEPLFLARVANPAAG
jgi:serine protease inhibitor